MPRPLRATACLGLALLAPNAPPPAPSPARPDPADAGYLAYLRQAPEFRPVSPPSPAWETRWDAWLYMPWRYRWAIGTGDAGGRFCQRYGIRGGVSDHARGPLPWLERWGLRFYNDHTAGKGALHLDAANPAEIAPAALCDPRAVRSRPLGPALLAELAGTIARDVRGLAGSPLRVAYALDDEISTGAFTRPAVWRLDGDDAGYARWLRSYYGGPAPPARWVTPDGVRGELARPLAAIDLSPLLDRMTYEDSQWAVFLGALIERCHRADPATPCGVVGGQAPSLWGGYDWAKLAHKIHFVEAYDRGSAPEIIRSLAPAIPRVTTHFHSDRRGAGYDVWLAWHSLAHGERGLVGWVDGWFDGEHPRPWLDRFAPALREVGGAAGRRMMGARALSDGIAIYYSQPSIQVSWLLDAEAHGATWPRRFDDERLGTSHLVRKAWEEMLTDAGLRYDFVAYDEVARHGVPAGYRVLILPACYALSAAEAARIAAFAAGGGTVIADFAGGLFDPHGRGRRRGILDDLFGIAHRGNETRADFFAGRLWVETDQEAGYGYRRLRELFATLRPRLADGYAIAEPRLPVGVSRRVGRGRAVCLNLSPQRYLMDVEEGTATPERRRPFLAPVLAAGVAPRLTVRPLAPGPGLPRLETTAWRARDGRILAFVLQKARVASGAEAEGPHLAERRLPIEVRLAAPVTGVVDERTGGKLPDGDRFRFTLDTTEAVFFSFAGAQGTPGGRR